MDVVELKRKKNGLVRAWERWWSLRPWGKKPSGTSCEALKKSKSWHCSPKSSSLEEDKGKKKCDQVAPQGCFSVYVGPQRQRFVIKTKFANHPLFKMLLEDAELEYGYSSEGPLLLPCDVDLFYKVLAEMDSGEEISTPVCSFAYSPLILCSPSHRQISSSINKGYGSYKLLTPSRMFKLNRQRIVKYQGGNKINQVVENKKVGRDPLFLIFHGCLFDVPCQRQSLGFTLLDNTSCHSDMREIHPGFNHLRRRWRNSVCVVSCLRVSPLSTSLIRLLQKSELLSLSLVISTSISAGVRAWKEVLRATVSN
ncbi:uncharacterized protein LOC111275201 [Durio zibethinus]|uniref:Uncharacterized protein LOC111275201 n=1 Tax=Durio zibethinus TaxID=66656 RepID=A0A6P5WJ12_DURZI|nr:uncharacterized protein LOC111275201 [Durio zibethinus]